MDNSQEYRVIKPHKGILNLNLKELWLYRDLIWLFAKRNIVVQYKQTILGPIWLILPPLITSGIFSFVFGGLANMSTDGAPEFLFYMTGNTIWNLFNLSVTNNSNIFLTNSTLYSKIYFPRMTLPISSVLSTAFGILIQFALLIVVELLFITIGFVPKIGWHLLAIPFIAIQSMMLGLGIGLLCSALTAKYRDLALAITYFMQLLFYVTPVIFPLSSTGGIMKTVLLMNPATAMVNNFRYAIIGSGQFLVGNWIYSIFITVIVLTIGTIVFSNVEKNFVDTI